MANKFEYCKNCGLVYFGIQRFECEACGYREFDSVTFSDTARGLTLRAPADDVHEPTCCNCRERENCGSLVDISSCSDWAARSQTSSSGNA